MSRYRAQDRAALLVAFVVILARPQNAAAFLGAIPRQQIQSSRRAAAISPRSARSQAATSDAQPLLKMPPNPFFRHPIRHSSCAVLSSALHLSSSTSASSLENNGRSEMRKDGKIILASTLVGAIAAAVGFLYNRTMKGGFELLWLTIPSIVFGGAAGSAGAANPLAAFLRSNPTAYFIGMFGLGASVVGAIGATFFPTLFTAKDYVAILSSSEKNNMKRFPPARRSVLPILLLSLLTSTTGFSMGPEAPMVCAGGLLGVSLARRYGRYFVDENEDRLEETLAYAGAAGTLTGFMGVPIAGPVFALEMCRSSTGMSKASFSSFGPTLAASVAAIILVRGLLDPSAAVGGHFAYTVVGSSVMELSGRTMVATGLGCGIVGAGLGTVFHKVYAMFKSILWPAPASSAAVAASTSASEGNSRRRAVGTAVLKKALVGCLIGFMSSRYPQTMFWGEGSLQSMIDGQVTPFSATPHGIHPALLGSACVIDPSVPWTANVPGAAWQIGIVKFLAISLAAAAKMPGGIIFPLLSNAAPFAHAISGTLGGLSPTVLPVAVFSLMAATLTSATRTPLATVLILAMSASPSTPLSAMLPAAFIASYVSVWASEVFSTKSYFVYS